SLLFPFSIYMPLHPPIPTLSPYTTLFRSDLAPQSDQIRRFASCRHAAGGRTARIARAVLPETALLHGEVESPQRSHRQNERRLRDRKSTRLNSSHGSISYAVFCLKKKKKK